MDTILGIPIGISSLEDILTEAVDFNGSRDGQFIFACANSHSLNVSRRDELFRAALLDAGHENQQFLRETNKARPDAP